MFGVLGHVHLLLGHVRSCLVC